MIIDCDSCEMRNIACDDCVVSVLLAAPRAVDQGDIEWSDDESGAFGSSRKVAWSRRSDCGIGRIGIGMPRRVDTGVTGVTDVTTRGNCWGPVLAGLAWLVRV